MGAEIDPATDIRERFRTGGTRSRVHIDSAVSLTASIDAVVALQDRIDYFNVVDEQWTLIENTSRFHRECQI